MIWAQYQMKLPPFARGLHLITDEVITAAEQLTDINQGLLNIFLQHTSASITINENADPDVRLDMEASLNRVAPESARYIHTCEGPDDMPAHVKSSLVGCSLNIPIRDGHLALGTWQGIYLCEHRNRASGRRMVLTVQGV